MHAMRATLLRSFGSFVVVGLRNKILKMFPSRHSAKINVPGLAMKVFVPDIKMNISEYCTTAFYNSSAKYNTVFICPAEINLLTCS